MTRWCRSRWLPVAAAPVGFFKLCSFVVLFFSSLFRANHKLFVKVVTMAGLSFVTLFRVLLLLFLIFVTENLAGSSGGIVYSCEQLIALCKPVLLPGNRPEVPQE